MGCLVWAIIFCRITLPQPIAIDVDYSAQHTTINNTWFTTELCEKGLKTHRLRIVYPENIIHVTTQFSNRESFRSIEMDIS